MGENVIASLVDFSSIFVCLNMTAQISVQAEEDKNHYLKLHSFAEDA